MRVFFTFFLLTGFILKEENYALSHSTKDYSWFVKANKDSWLLCPVNKPSCDSNDYHLYIKCYFGVNSKLVGLQLLPGNIMDDSHSRLVGLQLLPGNIMDDSHSNLKYGTLEKVVSIIYFDVLWNSASIKFKVTMNVLKDLNICFYNRGCIGSVLAPLMLSTHISATLTSTSCFLNSSIFHNRWIKQNFYSHHSTSYHEWFNLHLWTKSDTLKISTNANSHVIFFLSTLFSDNFKAFNFVVKVIFYVHPLLNKIYFPTEGFLAFLKIVQTKNRYSNICSVLEKSRYETMKDKNKCYEHVCCRRENIPMGICNEKMLNNGLRSLAIILKKDIVPPTKPTEHLFCSVDSKKSTTKINKTSITEQLSIKNTDGIDDLLEKDEFGEDIKYSVLSQSLVTETTETEENEKNITRTVVDVTDMQQINLTNMSKTSEDVALYLSIQPDSNNTLGLRVSERLFKDNNYQQSKLSNNNNNNDHETTTTASQGEHSKQALEARVLSTSISLGILALLLAFALGFYFCGRAKQQVNDDDLGRVRQGSDRMFEVLQELNTLTEEAKTKDGGHRCLLELEDHLMLAEIHHIPPELLKDSYVVLEDLKERLNTDDENEEIERMMKVLKTITEQAKAPNATRTVLKKLQEEVDFAVSLQVSLDKLKEPFEVLNKLSNRIEGVVKDIEDLTEEAKMPIANLNCMLKLQNKLSLAENLEIPLNPFEESLKILQSIHQEDGLPKGFKNLTEEAKKPTATLFCLQKLKKELSIAEDLFILPEYLQPHYETMKKLEERINKVKEDLNEITIAATDSDVSFTMIAPLQDKLFAAENLHFPRDSLKSAYAVLHKLTKKVQKETGLLKIICEEANKPTASLSLMKLLEKELVFAESHHAPWEMLETAFDALKKLKRHNNSINQIKKDLQSALSSNDTQLLTTVISQATTLYYRLLWNTSDQEFYKQLSSLLTHENDMADDTKQLLGQKLKKEHSERNEALMAVVQNVVKSGSLSWLQRTLEHDEYKSPVVGGDSQATSYLEFAKTMKNVLESLENSKSSIDSIFEPIKHEAFTHPSVAMTHLIEATFILLGEPEDKLKDWSFVLDLMAIVGKKGMKQRLLRLKLNDITKEETDVASNLLSSITPSEVKQMNEVAVIFHTWCKCMLEGKEYINKGEMKKRD